MADKIVYRRSLQVMIGNKAINLPTASFSAREGHDIISPVDEPFFGRSNELIELKTRFDLAADNRPSVVLLSGEPGMGKSRLVSKFTSGLGRDALVLSGSCTEFASGSIPYAPIRQALRGLLQRMPLDRVSELAGPAWAEVAKLSADFPVTGDGQAPPEGPLEVFLAVRNMLEHFGMHYTVVLVIEDVHWADHATLDLLAFLVRVKSTERMMLVCTHRSGLPQGHPLRRLLAEPGFTRHTHPIKLCGLTEPEFREFASSHSATWDTGRLERYFTISEGNPFYGGLLIAADDPKSQAASPLPQTLTEIIKAELDGLSEDAVAVLRIVAVVGRSVSDKLLARVGEASEVVAKLDHPALAKALWECLNRQILTTVEGGSNFRHALLRETVYDELREFERPGWHEAIAEALAAVAESGPRSRLEIAHHWYQTGKAPQALASAVIAGRLAVELGAYREAQTQFDHALEFWGAVADPQGTAGVSREWLLSAAADAARWAGDVDQALAWVREAIDELNSSATPARRGELFERLASYQWEAGVDESTATYLEAETLLDNEPASPVKARVKAALASSDIRRGNYRSGYERAQEAVLIAEQCEAPVELGRALNSKGLALALLDNPAEGIPLLRESLRIAEEHAHQEDLFRAWGNLGVALEHSGDLEGAVGVLSDGTARARALGLIGARRRAVLVNNTSMSLFLLGRWDEAVELLEEVLDRPISESVYFRLTRAQICVARGEWEQAQRLLDEARSNPKKDPRFQACLAVWSAEMAIWRGDLAQARDDIDRGIEAVHNRENTLVLLQLCAVGLRIAVDEMLMPVGKRGDRQEAAASFAQLAGIVEDTASAENSHGETLCFLLQSKAELLRRVHEDTDQTWDGVALAWEALGQPYPAAYARWRQADVLGRHRMREPASQAIRSAHQAAAKLKARPLLEQILATVKLYGLHLSASRSPAAERPEAKFGLTSREKQVLRELCGGRTNKQIGKKLFVSESTASVHVSNILRKLDVRSRAEAAILADKLRLCE